MEYSNPLNRSIGTVMYVMMGGPCAVIPRSVAELQCLAWLSFIYLQDPSNVHSEQLCAGRPQRIYPRSRPPRIVPSLAENNKTPACVPLEKSCNVYVPNAVRRRAPIRFQSFFKLIGRHPARHPSRSSCLSLPGLFGPARCNLLGRSWCRRP